MGLPQAHHLLDPRAQGHSPTPLCQITPESPGMGDPNEGTSAALLMLWAAGRPAELQEFSQSSRKGGYERVNQKKKKNLVFSKKKNILLQEQGLAEYLVYFLFHLSLASHS